MTSSKRHHHDGMADVEYIGDPSIPREPKSVQLIERIRTLPSVRSVTALGDAVGKKLEAPVSVVTESVDCVIPALGTNVINCGVGLLDTGLQEDELNQRDRRELLFRIWDRAHSGHYSFDRADVETAFLGGVPGLAQRGWISEADQNAFEFGGVAAGLECYLDDADLDRYVPWSIRRLPLTRKPTRLNLLGNHFLELQRIDDVENDALLQSMKLGSGRLMLMLHMDHRVTGGLNHHFVVRKTHSQRSFRKRVAYNVSKLHYHASTVGSWQDFRSRWKLYFKNAEYVPIPISAAEGRRYLTAYAMGMNYGYAGRAAIYRACLDVLRDNFSGSKQPRVLRDTSHESLEISRLDAGGMTVAVARKGAVRCVSGEPALIMGHFDSPSHLGVCGEGTQTGRAYDHGSTYVRSIFPPSPDRSVTSEQYPIRYVVSHSNGGASNPRVETYPLMDKTGIERLLQQLADRDAIRRVAWLSPVANLSQVR